MTGEAQRGPRGGDRRAFVLASLALVLGWVYVARLGQGLWEDGYFVKRFAYNYWHHGSFSWNVSDGPVYGMTSQTLQLLGTALYWLAPDYVVTTMKAVSCASLVALLAVLATFSPASAASADGTASAASADGAARDAEAGGGVARLLPSLVALSGVVVIEATFTGLETALGLLLVALASRELLRSPRGGYDALRIAALLEGVYLTRPDALWIPAFLLAARWLSAAAQRWKQGSPGVGRELAVLTAALALTAAALGLTLLVLHGYYGTALPLPFYLKTHGWSAQDPGYVAPFAAEKLKNLTQIVFLAAPLVFVALHERSRAVWLLLAAGLSFFAYHGFATIETMGYYSRFYLPGLVPLMAAAQLGYASFLRRRRWGWVVALYAGYVLAFILLKYVDNTHTVAIKVRAHLYLPALVALGLVLLCPLRWQRWGVLAVGACLCLGTALTFPMSWPRLETDEVILLRQASPRTAFPGIERLRAALAPKVIYHTDMGAPGLLFPEAKVVDLDGLLNEAVTLRGARFDELCRADRPEAIYYPKPNYARLRAEMSTSPCFQDYRAVTPQGVARLYVRSDLVAMFTAYEP
jgi:hypothetical protein